MKTILRYLLIALVCAAAVAARPACMSSHRASPPQSGGKATAQATAAGEKAHARRGREAERRAGRGGRHRAAARPGPRELREILRLNGIIQPNQETLVKVTPRFPGVIRSMRKRLGDKVRKDEVLATVESNQSLTTYELKAPIDGTVIDRDGTLGEFASEQRPLFTIADLSTMWIDFAVYRRDFARVRLGDAVLIDVGDGGPADRGPHRLCLAARRQRHAERRGARRRAQRGRLRPGLFVDGRVVLSATPVDVAVRASALQTLDGKTVVFVRDGDGLRRPRGRAGRARRRVGRGDVRPAGRRRLRRAEQLRDQGRDRQGQRRP